MRLIFAVFFVTIAALGTGCTYTNVPAQDGDIAVNDPNRPSTVTVTTVALQAAIADRPPAGTFQVVMPPGTVALTYEQTVPKLSPSATYSITRQPGMEIIEARNVRIRGWDAQVDVIRPVLASQPDGPAQLVTVYLDYDPFTHWRARDIRVWRIPLEQALIESRRGYETRVAP